MFKSIAEEYRSTLKSSDTEENIDLCFYRPIGFAWAWLFRKLGVHPNVVTIASMFLGVGAAICFYYSNIWMAPPMARVVREFLKVCSKARNLRIEMFTEE